MRYFIDLLIIPERIYNNCYTFIYVKVVKPDTRFMRQIPKGYQVQQIKRSMFSDREPLVKYPLYSISGRN